MRRNHMKAAEIAHAVNRLYVEPPSEWPPNYDINDFHKETKSLKEVATLLESAKAPDTPGTSVETLDSGNTLNDSGNAARLVKLFGHDIRWRSETKEWMTWNGQ